MSHKRLVLAFFLLFFTENAFAKKNNSPWQFEAGVSAGRPTPIMIGAGVGYESVFFRIMAGGLHLGADEFWIGYRGSLAWKFFHKQPFSLDLGMSGGYAFAKAPNYMHKALNRANNKRYLRSYNYKESLDISTVIRTNIYGFFTQLDIPFHYFIKHDEPTLFWQVGYALTF